VAGIKFELQKMITGHFSESETVKTIFSFQGTGYYLLRNEQGD